MDIQLLFSAFIGVVFVILILRSGSHLPSHTHIADNLLYNAEIKLRNAGLSVDNETVNVFLLRVTPEQHITTIKLIRTLTGAGLREAKEMTEQLPRLIKTALTPEDAQEIRRAFDAVNAEVDIL